MLNPTPYDKATMWMIDHGCTNPTGRYSVTYKEISRHIYEVTCNKCGALTKIENK
jgi:hypothetical protein